MESLLCHGHEHETYFLVSMPDRVLKSSIKPAKQRETGLVRRPKS